MHERVSSLVRAADGGGLGGLVVCRPRGELDGLRRHGVGELLEVSKRRGLRTRFRHQFWGQVGVFLRAAPQHRGGFDIGCNQLVRRQGGRVLFIETGSLPHYELTRRFYLKHGYEQHAVLKDFYAAGESMIVFRKEFV